MTPEELQSLLDLGSESRHVEFKGPGSLRDKAFRVKVVRAVLGMANTRDGGTVVVGVGEENRVPALVGLDDTQLSTWTPDDLADVVNQYCDPSVSMWMTYVTLDQRTVVVIQVNEFDNVPIVCRQDYPNVLNRGAYYIRSRRKAETSAVGTHEDMRDLVDLATEKSFLQLLARFHGIGVSIPDLASLQTRSAEDELRLLESLDQAQEIIRQPYWSVAVQPIFDVRPTELPFKDLDDLVHESSIEVAGWRYPYTRGGSEPERFDTFIQHRIQWQHKNEAWRMNQSGVFCFIGVLDLAWTDVWIPVGRTHDAAPLKRFPVITTLRHITAFMTFASRYTRKLPAHVATRITLTWLGVDDAELFLDSPRRAGFELTRYTYSGTEIEWTRQLSPSDLWARPAAIAREAASHVFERFGWNRSPETLDDLQIEAMPGQPVDR